MNMIMNMIKGLIWAYWEQHQQHKQWVEQIQASGIPDAITELIDVSSELLVDDVVSLAALSKQTDTKSSITTATQPNAKEKYVEYMKKKVLDTDYLTSVPLLAHSALKLEEIVLVDRLSIEFLRKRQQWRRLLSTLCTEEGRHSIIVHVILYLYLYLLHDYSLYIV